jgi:translation initiation factor 6
MQLINFFGNPNIGLFFYSTDSYTIVPKVIEDRTAKIIEDELKTQLIKVDVMGSSVNAIFLAGNEKIILAPKGISNESINELKKTGLKIEIIDTTFNAIGNNIAIYKNKAIVNPDLEESAIKQLEKLGFEVLKTRIAGVETVGANLALFKKKGLINAKAKESEIKKISEFLGIELELGTVSGGSPIIKAGFAKNSKGILVSEQMTGAEILMLEDLMK